MDVGANPRRPENAGKMMGKWWENNMQVTCHIETRLISFYFVVGTKTFKK